MRDERTFMSANSVEWFKNKKYKNTNNKNNKKAVLSQR